MGSGRERKESNCGPGAVRRDSAHVGHEHDWENAESADEQGDLAAAVRAEATMHEEAGERSACDGAYARDGVDGDDLPVGMGEVKAVVFIKELGEIEEIEPPDGIGEAFGEGEGVESALPAELAEESEEALIG